MSEQLDALVGEWKMESVDEGTVVASGKTTFAWLAGRSFLIQHTTADPPLPTTPQVWIDNSPFPIVAIISLDDRSQKFYYNYADGRGVHRVYDMSFKAGVWKFWGQAGAGFYQRMESKLSKDGDKITTHIEKSADNKTWETDFHTVYTKL
jgi:hypothetical protein